MGLFLKPSDFQGRPVPIGSAPVTIGRAPDNTIRLIDDRASRYHCVIEPDTGDGPYVRDLGSRNGTKVNSVKVERVRLAAGDRLKVGVHEWVVFAGGESNGPDTSQFDITAMNTKPTRRSRLPPWALDIHETMTSLPPKGQEGEKITLVDAGGEISTALVGDSDGPVAVRLLLQLASKARATDIHVEPKGGEHHVRMRVDGQMVQIVELPVEVGALISGLIKAVCQMKAAARDAALDGHFSARFPDRRVEYRASFTPSVHGQKLVLRVLDERLAPTSVDELGMPGWMRERIRRVCEQDQGLLMCCGPTGSGKTTTLYNAIREIDRNRRNVVTIEDPVEYQLSGVTQIPIDEHKGNTFGSLLRSVLRQDPDVILVGEIRDEETARTAMQAAMTGHVVFTTVHSKDSISAIFRLLDLKVEPYLVANALDLVVAQRLVRVLCETCKSEAPLSAGQITRLGRFLGGATTSFTATGCPRCLRTGYRGRRAIFELLELTDDFRDVILQTPTIADMKRVVAGGIFQTLQQSGWRLVAEGVTSLDEVDRVAGS